MREYTAKDKTKNLGACFLIYGETNVGKTTSFDTLPEPILVIVTEPRDPRLVLSHTTKDFTFREYDTFDEYLEALDTLNREYEGGKCKFASICFDSLSFFQSKLKADVEDARFDKDSTPVLVSDKRKKNTLVDRFRMERPDWGALGSMMKRLTWLLNRLSKYGVIVVATAVTVEYPTWDRELVAAPAFQGIDYGSVFNSYFDFIGYVRKGHPKPYPPVVSFVSKSDEPFICKSSSRALNDKGGTGILNFEKILAVIRRKNV